MGVLSNTVPAGELVPEHAPWTFVEPVAVGGGAGYPCSRRELMGKRIVSAISSRSNAGGLVTTDGLAAHLKLWSGVHIEPSWERYVHGRG